MLSFYHIRQEFRFKPGLKPDQTGSSGSGSALLLNQTRGSVSGSAKKVPNQTKLDFGNTTLSVLGNCFRFASKTVLIEELLNNFDSSVTEICSLLIEVVLCLDEDNLKIY
jgi:hypothetical protein